jgi:hypothetical protein
VALADPDLPPGIALPELSPTPPLGLNADRYRWLREAFYELPRRSRVVIVLRLPLPDRRPLPLRAIAELFRVTLERIRFSAGSRSTTARSASSPVGPSRTRRSSSSAATRRP